ncbi:MAG: PAS domain-containing protein [Candidatus Methanoperedenaceae archaeon]|nr:PAS domain-containing protein [Candidatus Methanoperedenaceae archaeon]
MSQDIKCISFVNPKGKKVLIVDFDPRANEELETSREELQSVNEELMTLNSEHQTRIEENLRVINDMNNLFTSTEIATVFLDNDLNIKGFTPASTKIINLIKTDIGRPVKDFSSNLVYENLIDDVLEVLNTLVFRETEVSDKNGNWYLMRIMPYRTTENVIDGGVVTFIDITERKRAEKALRKAHDELEMRVQERTAELVEVNVALQADITERKRAEESLSIQNAVVRNMTDAVYIFKLENLKDDKSLRILFANPAVKGVEGVDPEDVVGKRLIEAFPEVRRTNLLKLYADVVRSGKSKHVGEIHYESKIVTPGEYDVRAVPLGGDCVGVIFANVTERKRNEEQIKILNEQQQTILDASPAIIVYKDKENRFIRVNEAMARAIGKSKQEVEGKTCWDLFPQEAADHYWQDDKEVIATGKSKLNIIESMETPDGTTWVQTDKILYRDSKGEIVGIIGFALDITERKRAEETLRKTEEKFRNVIENIFKFVPEGLVVLTDKLNLFRRNKAFEDLVRQYAVKLNYSEEELADILIEQIKTRLVNGEKSEIRISRKHK